MASTHSEGAHAGAAPQNHASSVDSSNPFGTDNRATAKGYAVSNDHDETNKRGCFHDLFDPIAHVVHIIIPPGGILSGAFNMASVSIGAGILGLPAAAEKSGLFLSVLMIALIGIYSVYSMYILAYTAQVTHIKTFEAMGRFLFPYRNYAFSYYVAFARWFHTFSAGVAYVICIENCLDPILKGAYERNPHDSALKFFKSNNGKRLLTTIIWLFIMFPLVIPKHVDSLRLPSMFSVVFVIFFGLCVIIHSAMNGFKKNHHNIIWTDAHSKTDPSSAVYVFRSGNDVVVSIGVYMFAYVCQINALEIFWEMPSEIRNRAKYTISASIGMFVTGTLYILVAVFGYLDFGSARISGNSLLLMYHPLKDAMMFVAYIGVMSKICAAYALQMNGSRNVLHYVIGWQAKYAVPATPQDNDEEKEAPAGNHSERPIEESFPIQPNVVCSVGDETKECFDIDDTLYLDNIPFLRHLILVVIMAVINLLCGLFIPNINTVFGFAGGFSGSNMGFILPALFFMYSGIFTVEKIGWFNYLCTYSLLFCGVFGLVFGTIGTIYSTV